MHWSMGRRFRRRGWKNWRIRGRREGGLEEEWGSGKGERGGWRGRLQAYRDAGGKKMVEKRCRIDKRGLRKK